ncbi:MAG: Outer membrane autotransporter barrel domain protein [candidate division CPR2 bacterium GW2011_GWC2_39_10]|uniref:Outer membrane autotransporter barrel domain protein n=1 Tax=candidate division CPR2 bacterium GW2011_GWC2_39_10 TaxID=1618345 RepID=A0A0G0PWF7_UNCC2|nr:MAG: Outer membrane autotransporter barrel domain protein [candidate division CPR2 bacterium GW2011_GWC2_39_10]
MGILTNPQIQNKKNQKGSILLYSLIISMIVLSIGLSIAQIVLTEIKASGDATSSQQAYLAAETGMEEVALLLKSGNPIPTGEIVLAGGGKYYASSGNVFKNNICYQRLTVKGGHGGIVREIIKDDPTEIDIVITGTVIIKDLYELSSVSGVTICGQANKGLGNGAGTYNPDSADGTGYPVAKNITIKSTGNLTTTDPSGLNPGQKLRLEAKNTLTIEDGGKIDATGKGYRGGFGHCSSAIAGDCNGKGPGGGIGNQYGWGGGVIIIRVANLDIKGTNPAFPAIISNGINGSNAVYGAGGGGSGGSIYIISQSDIVRANLITANGGGRGRGCNSGGGGGGGGGRIKIKAPNSASLVPLPTLDGGLDNNDGYSCNYRPASPGNPGVYTPESP